MENFNVTIGKLTGKPSSQGWVQVYDFKPEDPKKLGEKGRIFALIATDNVYSSDLGNVSEEGIDSVLAGREILARFQEEYFGAMEESVGPKNPNKASLLMKLKFAASKIIQEFSKWDKVQVGAIVAIGETLYLVCGGGSSIYVIRDGVYVPVLKSSLGETVSASGNIRDNDTFLIGTGSFFKKFAQGVLKAMLGSKDIGSFSEYFAPLIHSDSAAFNTGALVLKFNKENAPLVEPSVKQGTLTEFGGVASDRIKPEKPAATKYWKDFEIKMKQFLQKKLYVKAENDFEGSYKKRKVSLTVGLLLLFVLVVSIIFGIRQKRALDLKRKYEAEIRSAQHELEESLNLSSLNPERSRELFLEARSKVLGLADSEINDSRLDDLKKSIQDNQGELLGEYRETPELLTDLGLLSDGFRGTDMVETQGNLYILDKASEKIVKIVISNKRSEVVAGPSKVDKAQGLSAYGDYVYTLGDEGVFEVTNEKKKALEKLWQGDFLVGSYAGNLYILEKLVSKIYRFGGSDGVFGNPKEWLSSQSNADLKSAISWAIDGNIWVLMDDGSVDKFSLGNIQQFKLGDRFGSAKWNFIFTDDEAKDLYFLDRENGRVTVFDKEGNYVAEYVSDDIKQTLQIAVSEKDKKLILLNGAKLLSIYLRHLD